jgi:hypothetical protein
MDIDLFKPAPRQSAGEKLRKLVIDVHEAQQELPPSRVRQIAFQMANDGDEIRVPSRRERRRKAR